MATPGEPPSLDPQPQSETATLPPAAVIAEPPTLRPPVSGDAVTLPPPPAILDSETLAPMGSVDVAGTGASVPGYEIIRELGRGGMGVVYQARHLKLNRPVALKMILAGSHAGAADLARFQTEAEAIARLRHPNIVQVYEVGEHEGKPYFSLEFCGGGSLEKKLNGTPLTPKEAAALVETLARAMRAAHEQKVIHRDLKPANVLLAEDGTPKITDFGLAKKLDEAGQTQSGAIMGTPSYMAPEQAGGKSNETGPLADVYALGAILYECLTGRPPFKAATALDTLVQVVSEQPAPPSLLSPQVPRDLVTICLKCLRKEPEKRYASAQALAEDLRRFQAGEPIVARPVGRLERVTKWARRRPAAAALASVGIVTVLVLVGLLVSLGYSMEMATAYQREQELRTDAEHSREDALNSRERLKGEKEKTEAALEAEQQARTREAVAQDLLEQAFYLRRVASAYSEWRDNQVEGARALLADCPASRRHWEWNFVARLCEGGKLTVRHSMGVVSVCFSPDGTRVASASRDGMIRLWGPQSGDIKLTIKGRNEGHCCMCFHPDGKQLVQGCSDGTVQVWDTVNGQKLRTLRGHTAYITSVCFDSHGKLLASGSGDKTVKIWHAETGEKMLSIDGHADIVSSVSFGPDGKQLASASAGTVQVWDTETGQKAIPPKAHNGTVKSVCYSPDGKSVASASSEQKGSRIKVWDAQSGQEVCSRNAPAGTIESLAFSPDGLRLAGGVGDGTIKTWDVRTGDEQLTLKGHTTVVRCICSSPDGKLLASASEDRTARVWDAQSGQEARTFLGHAGFVYGVCMSPDGNRLASISGDRTVRVWDTRSGQTVLAIKGGIGGWVSDRSVSFSPDGKRLAGLSGETVKVWALENGQEVFTLKAPTGRVSSACFSRDGRRLACGVGTAIRLLDAQTGEDVCSLTGHTQRVKSVCFSPDSQRLASCSEGGTLRVWDLQTTKQTLLVNQPAYVLGGLESICFSPDGKALAGASIHWVFKVWDAATGREVMAFRGHNLPTPGQFYHPVTSICFSPDGRRLACATSGNVKVWDIQTGQEAITLKGHTSGVWCVSFSQDGTTLVSGSSDGTVQIWDARPLPDQGGPKATGK
jgi:WD40 repeat protein